MNLDQLSGRDFRLRGLLQQSGQWQRLDGEIKKILPANLHPHFQTACVENGCLVLLAANNMASSRLKMIMPSLLPRLQSVREDIIEVKIKVVPQQPQAPKQNRLHLSEEALVHFERSAGCLQHHPELAEALSKLVRHHREQ